MKKFTRLTAILFFIAGNCFAQFNLAWNAQYQHSTTLNYSNEARKIVEDPAGNIFVMSDITSDIDPFGVQGTTTYHYISVLKYSTLGAIVGRLEINVHDHLVFGFNNVSAFGLEVDATGNIYIGYTNWNSTNGFDVILAKYANDLTRVWSNSHPVSGNDYGVDMKLHASGTIYAVIKSVNGANTSYSLIKSVPSTSPSIDVYSFVANGPVINSLAINAAGSMAYLGGYTVKAGFKNAYVAAINTSNNTFSWASNYSAAGFLGDDVVNKIVVGVDGNIYSVGTSAQGFGQGNQVLVLKNLVGNNKFDFMVLLGDVQVNDHGLIIYASEPNWLYIASTADLNLVVYRIPTSGNFITPSSVRYTPQPGGVYNTINTVTLNAMKVSANKNIYITGGVSASGPSGDFVSSYMAKSSVVFGNVLISSGAAQPDGDFDRNFEGIDISLDYGKADVYVLRNYWEDQHSSEVVELTDLNAPSPLRLGLQQDLIDVSLAPNPSNGIIKIESDAVIYNIELVDMTGKQVLNVTDESKEIIINVETFNPGIYFCKIMTTDGEVLKRVVVN
jgi:hypothetical protein